MSNKVSLSSIINAFKQSESTGHNPNYYPFTKMLTDTQAVIRFLPDKNENNPMGFLIEKVQHTLEVNGDTKIVPCLSMYKEDCPICAVSQQFYKSGDKTNGKKYWKKKVHIAQALIVSDPLPADSETGETSEGKVRYVNLGFQLFNIIKSAFESGDLDEIPFAYKGGYNFNIKKTQQGEYPNYSLGSNFARRPSDLSEEEIAMVEEEIVDLSTLLPNHPGAEKIEAMLNAALTGEMYIDENDSDSDSVLAGLVRQASKSPIEKGEKEPSLEPELTSRQQALTSEPVVKTKTTSVSEEDEELEEDAEDILAKIRQRRKSKNS